PHRAMMLFYEGENAIRKIHDAAGGFDDAQESADTVRGTYGDFVHDPDGNMVYFEPAVLIGPTLDCAKESLKLWMEYAESDGGIIDDALSLPDSNVEKTLVIIKPDNFRFPSARPGNIIDLFSRASLRIIGAQVHRMSMAEAKEFYGPVQAVLREKLTDCTVIRALSALKNEFQFDMHDEVAQALRTTLGPYYGDHQFYGIMQFMTGLWLPDVPEHEIYEDGKVRCLVLIYAGTDAVNKIRRILGPTDPSKALPGSVRKEYGSDIMINAAHASDSPGNAAREMQILKPERNTLKKWVDRYYA
ncbi:MAG TPA: nucleoside-diphosphate kinase, partial [Tichowtungia sp.]|nr:nucleoside-diphosphate kinase [Tichowtungia sp.]